MTARTVQIGMATYTDPSGSRRIGQLGERVDVHADDVTRFDRVNGPAPESKPAVKKAAPAQRKASAKKAAPQKRTARRR